VSAASEPEPASGPRGYDWAFVALSYHTLILNRAYVVLVSEEVVAGAVARRIVMSPGAAPADEWNNPWFYTKERLVRRYNGIDVRSDAFLAVDRGGFRIDRRELADVTVDLSPKWGMGYVPYSGRINLRTRDGRSRELILLGRQDAGLIRDRLRPVD
jgi:hypothetical protein